VQHDLHLRAPALVLTVGPAASGKSTLLARLSGLGVLDLVVSTDALRAELGLAPDETDVTYAHARRRVVDGLRAGLLVAVDATNVRVSDRAAWRAVASDAGVDEVVALRVGVGVPVAQLALADAGRDRHVPVSVIAEQHALAAASGPAQLRAEGLVPVDAGVARWVRCGSACDAHPGAVGLLPAPAALTA
jgi:predicted kinase